MCPCIIGDLWPADQLRCSRPSCLDPHLRPGHCFKSLPLGSRSLLATLQSTELVSPNASQWPTRKSQGCESALFA